MGIGAIGAFQPYVFNTNMLSVNSLNPVSAVGNDVQNSHLNTEKLTPYSGQTINPLSLGETSNFADILGMQMQMGMNQADQLFGENSVFAN